MTEIYDALEDCLEAMARGASADNAVKRFPKLAHELRPLLEASLMAKDLVRIHVPLDVRRRGRSHLLQQVRAINERGLVEQFNLQSVYAVPSGQRLVVVTNRDRTLTMIHLDAGIA